MTGIDYEQFVGSRQIEAAHGDVWTNPFPGIQRVLQAAMSDAVPGLDSTAAAEFARLDDPEGFYHSRRDPNEDVENGRLRAGQSFSDPVIVLAKSEGSVVGYAHGALNVSGSRATQAYKRFFDTRQYSFIRELVVLPDFQRKGIGTSLGAMLVQALNPRNSRPISGHMIMESESIQDFVNGLAVPLQADQQTRHTTRSGLGTYTTQPTYVRDASHVRQVHEHLMARISK